MQQRLVDQGRARAAAEAIHIRTFTATTGLDYWLVRGVPIMVQGVGGAMRGSVPHRDGLRYVRVRRYDA